MSRKDTLFVGSLPNEITEELLKKHFSEYGNVINVVIPRDRNSRRHKNYAFVQFATEEEAIRIYDNAEVSAPMIMDKVAIISWAYTNKGEKLSPVRVSKHSKSRSRSPKRNIESWSKPKIEDLQRDKYEMLDNISRLEKKIKEAKILHEELKGEIQNLKSQTKVFLPCGHSKYLLDKEKSLLDDLYSESLSTLTPLERTNEILVRQLKSRIFYILESKQPDTYRCKELIRVANESCKHETEMECWQVRDIKKNSRRCREIVEKVLPCGHTEKTVCGAESNICKQCYS